MNPAFTELAALLATTPRPRHAPFFLRVDVPLVAPRQTIVLRTSPRTDRPVILFHGRLLAQSTAQPPDLRYFQRGVGGSKRRGRRASWLHAAELLRHVRQRPRAALTLDDIAWRSRGHFIRPLPFAYMEGEGLEVSMAEFRPDDEIELRVTNHETGRAVRGLVVIGGHQEVP